MVFIDWWPAALPPPLSLSTPYPDAVESIQGADGGLGLVPFSSKRIKKSLNFTAWPWPFFDAPSWCSKPSPVRFFFVSSFAADETPAKEIGFGSSSFTRWRFSCFASFHQRFAVFFLSQLLHRTLVPSGRRKLIECNGRWFYRSDPAAARWRPPLSPIRTEATRISLFPSLPMRLTRSRVETHSVDEYVCLPVNQSDRERGQRSVYDAIVTMREVERSSCTMKPFSIRIKFFCGFSESRCYRCCTRKRWRPGSSCNAVLTWWARFDPVFFYFPIQFFFVAFVFIRFTRLFSITLPPRMARSYFESISRSSLP